MIPLIGNLTLAFSCGLAVLLMIAPAAGIWLNNQTMMRSARPLVYMLFASLLAAVLLLIYSLLTNDFSVQYVANNSNSKLPYFYKIAASWGAHEGSLLLWSFLLAAWTLAVARPHPEIEEKATLYILSVMGFVNLGFLLFITLTSNPFTTILPVPIEGRDLNPLLQDIGLIFHPPLLYMGYVGFSVAFAFAIAALLMGRFDAQWIQWFRPWVLVAWVFLGAGILLGSIWAYRELGWGGWWFWDPVENSSLMPWITGTALLHSILVAKKRDTSKIWTLLLAITTFSLCLIGTFLVRSGILVSVHAFSSDPGRGIFILAFLVAVIGGSLLLFAIRGHTIKNKSHYTSLLSKDIFIIGGNTVLLTAMLIVFLGTLYPLVHKQFGWGSISIGAPFFNSMFYWLMIPFALLIGIAPILKWQQDKLSSLVKPASIITIVSLLFALVLAYWIPEQFYIYNLIALFMACWIALFSLYSVLLRISSGQKISQINASHWGMFVAHMGVAMVIMGTSISYYYQVERTDLVKLGQALSVGEYDFTMTDIKFIQGPNYIGERARFEVTQHQQPIATLHPEKRIYTAQRGMPMTEVAIDSTVARDLYVALSDKQGADNWAVRVYYKPFIFWIWFGGLCIILGGLLAIFDRYLRLKSSSEALPSTEGSKGLA